MTERQDGDVVQQPTETTSAEKALPDPYLAHATQASLFAVADARRHSGENIARSTVSALSNVGVVIAPSRRDSRVRSTLRS